MCILNAHEWMTMKKLPVLIIIPHGGSKIPEELSGYEQLIDFDLLHESDACANEIFSFRDETIALVDTYISRLFVDMDRDPLGIPRLEGDGVTKKRTSQGSSVFGDGLFPDEIALAAMVRRYHVPFHDTVAKVLRTGDIRLILDCHTMMAVGPGGAPDSGMPRPLVSVQNTVDTEKGIAATAPDDMALGLLESLGKEFESETVTVARRFSHNAPHFSGFIMKKYGLAKVPLLRVSLSRALFFNDRYFSYEYLKVDPLRIEGIRTCVLKALEKFIARRFRV
jgi:N-formylglutamate deformylase